MLEIANRYKATHAVALTAVIVALPNGREYFVPKGTVFPVSPETARCAALDGLVRPIDVTTDMSSNVWPGDVQSKELFARHAGKFYDLAYDGAVLAVKITKYKEPPKPTVVDCSVRDGARPSPPRVTGFEWPPRV